MESLFMNFVPSNWLHAVGITLFHSLWLGVILSLLTGLVIFLTRKSSAITRYNLLTACLGLFVIAVIAIFLKELTPSADLKEQLVQQVSVDLSSTITFDRNLPGAARVNIYNQVSGLISLWDSYSVQIVLIWFLIICAKSIQLLAGLNNVFYLRRTKINDAGRFWEAKVTELSARLKIRSTVKIVQSGIAKVPMVAGHFKPLILIPLGMLNGLSVTEVEAILCHELAHIKRRDYMVNILQSFVEILFFFNPAVLWISALIKTERENCCDDLALSCVNDKNNYVKALISCQEFQIETPEYVMALTGRKNQLLTRVSRMLFNTVPAFNRVEKAVLTVTLISAFILMAAFTNVKTIESVERSNKSIEQFDIQPVVWCDPVVNKIYLQDTTKKVKPKRTIKKKTAQYKSGHVVKTTTESQEVLILEQAVNKEQVVNDKNIKDKSAAGQKEVKYKRDQISYKREKQQYKLDQVKYAKQELKYKQDSLKYNNKHLYEPKNLKIVEPAPPAPPVNPMEESEVSTKTGTISKVRSVSITNEDGASTKDRTEEINKEMFKDGVITQTDQLSYKIDNTELIVNGKKQPDKLHRKYRSKYLKGANTALVYNYMISTKK